jgi:hypothetical protein
MGYDGVVLKNMPQGLNFNLIYSVVVSGDFPNPCGHALMYIPFQNSLSAGGGYYFQIAGVYNYPHGMDVAGYKKYLETNEKKEIKRYGVSLSKPDKAKSRLAELIGKRWAWAVLPNNCAAFVEDIARAGGSSAGLWSNCPSMEDFDKPLYVKAINELDRYVKHIYRIPF